MTHEIASRVSSYRFWSAIRTSEIQAFREDRMFGADRLFAMDAALVAFPFAQSAYHCLGSEKQDEDLIEFR
jgi:hypothetical protein